jgi:hypothetical protein
MNLSILYNREVLSNLVNRVKQMKKINDKNNKIIIEEKTQINWVKKRKN